MIQVKIKLSIYELGLLQHIMRMAAEKPLRPDMRIETIILAENWQTWVKKYVSADRKKLRSYTIALSLARILHHRLQRIPMSPVSQSLLSKLDQELTNLSMKPPFSEQIPLS